MLITKPGEACSLRAQTLLAYVKLNNLSYPASSAHIDNSKIHLSLAWRWMLCHCFNRSLQLLLHVAVGITDLSVPMIRIQCLFYYKTDGKVKSHTKMSKQSRLFSSFQLIGLIKSRAVFDCNIYYSIFWVESRNYANFFDIFAHKNIICVNLLLSLISNTYIICV